MSAPADKPPPRDYSHELELHHSRVVRHAYFAGGVLSLALGVVGVFLPVLPTTPFLLLAAACFVRSSARFYNWLLNHRLFGSSIRNYRRSGAIPLRAKILAITLIALTIGGSILFVIPLWPVKALLAVIGVSVSAYLATRPTLTREMAARFASEDAKYAEDAEVAQRAGRRD